MIIPDTNLLLYAHHAGDALHHQARAWWEELANGTERVGLPWVVSTGFVRISTNPRILEQPLPTQQALEYVTEWLTRPHITPINPGSNHVPLFSQLLSQIGAGGNLVTDAHIAALAIEYQAVVHSHDQDFARFPGLRWRDPLQDAR